MKVRNFPILFVYLPRSILRIIPKTEIIAFLKLFLNFFQKTTQKFSLNENSGKNHSSIFTISRESCSCSVVVSFFKKIKNIDRNCWNFNILKNRSQRWKTYHFQFQPVLHRNFNTWEKVNRPIKYGL